MGLKETGNERPRFAAIGCIIGAESRIERRFFKPDLTPVCETRETESDQSQPFPGYESQADVHCEDACIDGMTQHAIRAGAHDFVPGHDRDSAAPVGPEMTPRPDRNSESGDLNG